MPLLHVAVRPGTGCISVLDARETLRNFPRNEVEYSATHTLAARSGGAKSQFVGCRCERCHWLGHCNARS